MADKAKLRGAFKSLSDTLAFRSDPSFPPDLAGKWLGALAHTSSIGRRQTDWAALPRAADAFDPVIARLDDATHQLADADTTAERVEGLATAKTALDALDAVLDTPPG